MARFSDLINGTPANGYVPLNKAGDSLSSTNGSGFLGYPPQSPVPSTPGSGFRLYANASGLLEWKGTNGFTRTFDGSANTADRAYTLPNSSGTIALTSDLSSYFPVAGGSLTGTGGAGFYGAIPQSSAPSTPASGFRLYANASGLLEWKGTNGFTRTFDGSANTADRAYTLPNSSGTIALEGTLTSLANPTIQNTYYQFVQTTAPTQRAVGVPLVAGDRWFKPIDNGVDNTTGWWFWTGSLWVSPLLEITNMQLTSIATTSSGFYGTINTVGSILVTRAVVYTLVSNTNNTSNYWTLDASLQSIQANSRSVLASFSTQNDTVNFRLGKAVSLNTVVDSGFPGNISGMTLHLAWTKVNNPGNLFAGCSLSYRHIHP